MTIVQSEYLCSRCLGHTVLDLPECVGHTGHSLREATCGDAFTKVAVFQGYGSNHGRLAIPSYTDKNLTILDISAAYVTHQNKSLC